MSKIISTLLISLILFLTTGCVRNIDSNGLTLKLEESQLNKKSDKFPIKENFVFANVNIQQPKIYIKDGTNRLNAKIDLILSALFIPSSKGTFEISGEPYFNKEKSAIFLKNIAIDDLKFTDLDVNKRFINSLISNMQPIVDTIFEDMPIYEIDKDSFRGSFVKDIKIDNSELLVTFGL